MPRVRLDLGIWVVLLSVAPGLVGCKKDSKESGGASGASAATTGEASAAAEAGVIKGTVTTTDGRPVKSIGGGISGYSAKSGQNVSATIDGADGKYRVAVGPGQFATRAWTDVEYNGRNYRIDLCPVDGKPVLAKQDTTAGVIKNFVWKLDGFRPGSDARSDDRFYGHFGGSINFNPEGQGATYWADIKGDYAHAPEPKIPPDATVELTLTPDGPLIDGSTGKPVVLTQTPGKVTGYMDRITRGIPIGRYKVTARAKLVDGTVKPLRVTPYYQFKNKQAPEPATTAVLEFVQSKPNSDIVNGVDEVIVHVMY
jgi:hypothetical protein